MDSLSKRTDHINKSFKSYWLAETLRLREAHRGPFEDAAEVRRARIEGKTFAQQILWRAHLLGTREKFDQKLDSWIGAARWAFIVLILLAAIGGAGAALSALDTGTRSVNLLVALGALLGLHAITFILWLISIAVRTVPDSTWLGQAWLWLTARLARGPDSALAPRALVRVLQRCGAFRWVLASISHVLWATALLCAVLTLLITLSARRFTFNWETTLLSPDAFVSITQALGWLPSLLGFPIPAESVIRASDGLGALPPSAQVAWSSWLVGCVVVYGLLPRLIALASSVSLARRYLDRISIDEHLPAYVELRNRFQPPSERMKADAPAGPEVLRRQHSAAPMDAGAHRSAAIAGIELGNSLAWPPSHLPAPTDDAGVIDDRAQRHAFLDSLHAQPVHRLVLVCDGSQTPDRGVVHFIGEVIDLAGDTRIVLLAEESRPQRQASWKERLSATGIDTHHIFTTLEPALAWLEDAHEPGPANRL